MKDLRIKTYEAYIALEESVESVPASKARIVKQILEPVAADIIVMPPDAPKPEWQVLQSTILQATKDLKAFIV